VTAVKIKPIISIKNLTQSYGNTVILNNISLDILKGEIIGILGPSGSGKTTLIKSIIGMQKIAKGDICVLDTKMPSLEVISRIGYMSQADALYEDLSAYDNLMFFASLYNLKGKEAKTRAEYVLELTHLKAHYKKPVRNFSGGMKRRLSLALSLLHRPELLILDEPTVGIDPVLRKEFWLEFESLKAEGCTILITTHAMDEAEKCDRLALLRDGEIIALGSPKELKQQANASTIEDAFLHFGSFKEGE
jgi:ABC-2 type transport system ATP-binding protein